MPCQLIAADILVELGLSISEKWKENPFKMGEAMSAEISINISVDTASYRRQFDNQA
jgi:hypothetical protein